LLRGLLLAVITRFMLSTRVAADNFEFLSAAVITATLFLTAASADA
jgi:hypothetical protein